MNQSALEAVSGARLLPADLRDVTVSSAGAVVSGPAVAVGSDPGYDGMATLTGGRWPTGPHEALAGGLGQAAGIPIGATVRIRDLDDAGTASRTARIVGTARTTEPTVLVQRPDPMTASRWILLREKGFDAAESKRLSDYGFAVASRQLLASAPTDHGSDETARYATITAMLTAGVIVVVGALVAPVFVIGARRGRSTIAIFTGSGATTGQRRRYLLAQALLVGVLAAVVAPVMGGAAGAVTVLAYRHRNPAAWAGPLVVPWVWGLLMMAVAIGTSVVAALIPAVASARRSVTAELADEPEGDPQWWSLVVAVLTVIVASDLVWDGIGQSLGGPMGNAALSVTVGGVLLYLGWLMVVPTVLTRLAAIATRIPVGPRIAIRDLARRRGRAVAIVGSVVATVGVLVAILIPLTSQRASIVHTYQPEVEPGQILVQASNGSLAEKPAVIRRVLPGAHVAATGWAGASSGTDTGPGRTLWIPAAGCRDAPAGGSLATGAGCAPALSSGGSWAGQARGTPIVGSPDDLARVYRLAPAERAVLEAGGIVVDRSVATAMGLRGGSGQTSLHSAQVTGADSSRPTVSQERQLTVPVAQAGRGLTVVARNPAAERASLPEAGALIPLTQVRALGVSANLDEFRVTRPGGVSASDADRLQRAFAGTAAVQLGVADPPTLGPSPVLIALVGAVLTLLAVGSGTFLAQADRQGDEHMFVRLGASAGLRRGVNAWYAALTTLLGVLLGCAAGTVPGIAMAIQAQSRAEVFAMPWAAIGLLVIATPLVAAGIAASCGRGSRGFRSNRVRLR